MFQGISKVFQGSFKEISRVFDRRLKGVFGSFMGVGCVNAVSWVFQGSFKEVSRKFQGHFKKGPRVFQGRLKGVSREFSVGFRGI